MDHLIYTINGVLSLLLAGFIAGAKWRSWRLWNKRLRKLSNSQLKWMIEALSYERDRRKENTTESGKDKK